MIKTFHSILWVLSMPVIVIKKMNVAEKVVWSVAWSIVWVFGSFFLVVVAIAGSANRQQLDDRTVLVISVVVPFSFLFILLVPWLVFIAIFAIFQKITPLSVWWWILWLIATVLNPAAPFIASVAVALVFVHRKVDHLRGKRAPQS